MSSEKSRARSRNEAPPLRRAIRICAFSAASCGVAASLRLRLFSCGSRPGVTTICARCQLSSSRLNDSRFFSKKAATSASLTVAFATTSRSSSFCVSRSRRSASRMSSAVRFRRFNSSWYCSSVDVLARLGVGGVELRGGQLDLQRSGLGQEDVAEDELVEQLELGLERLVLGRRRVRRRGAPVRLLDVVARDGTTVHHGPRVGRDGRCLGRLTARPGDDQERQPGQENKMTGSGNEHPGILPAPPRRGENIDRTGWLRRTSARDRVTPVGGLHGVGRRPAGGMGSGGLTYRRRLELALIGMRANHGRRTL